MEKIKILIDSTSDLSLEEIAKYDIEVVSLTVNIDGNEYDYKTIGNKEYIEAMRNTDDFSTSQPAIGKFYEIFDNYTKKGYKLIYLSVSSVLSGTYNTAFSAAADYDNVYVIDTKVTSRGIKYLLDKCKDYIAQGKTAEEIVELIEKYKKNILIYVTIDNFSNLAKGGRIRKTAALIGGLLNIKVLTQLKFDELAVIDKVRGKKKLISSLIKNIDEARAGRSIKQISLPNTLAAEYLDLIKEALKTKFNYEVSEEEIMITSPVISTHTGENAVGVIVELA